MEIITITSTAPKRAVLVEDRSMRVNLLRFEGDDELQGRLGLRCRSTRYHAGGCWLLATRLSEVPSDHWANLVATPVHWRVCIAPSIPLPRPLPDNLEISARGPRFAAHCLWVRIQKLVRRVGGEFHRPTNSMGTRMITGTGKPDLRAGRKRHWRTAATAAVSNASSLGP